MPIAIEFSAARLADTCKRNHIRRFSLFGSVLSDDFGPNSDVDALVEFEPEHTPGWEIVDIGDELSQVFGGRYVDIVNPKYLIPGLRESILQSAQVHYEADNAEG